MMSKMIIFMCSELEWQKHIPGWPQLKYNDNQVWKLVYITDHYFIRFVLGKINIFDIPISSKKKIIIIGVVERQR